VSSATKHDPGLRTEVRVARRLSGSLVIRRQTPLVAAAKADLDLCRSQSDAPPPASVTRRVMLAAIAELAEKTRASIRSAYRPKPKSGGAYSLVGGTLEEKVAMSRPGVRAGRTPNR